MDAVARVRFGASVERLTGRLQALLQAVGGAPPEDLASSVVAEMVGALSVSRALPPGPEADAVLHRSRSALLARCGVEDPA